LIHTVFFDAGGTLIRFGNLLGRASSLIPGAEANPEILKSVEKAFAARYLDHSGPFQSIESILAEALKQTSAAFQSTDVSDRAGEIIATLSRQATLFDDARPVLDELKQRGITLHMISDADTSVLFDQLRRLDLLDYFDAILVSGEIGAYKPSDTMVDAARVLCRDPLRGILLVGDHAVDVETARKLGVRSVLIDRDGISQALADIRIQSLSNLPALL
jgi:putative hydrolase of the HAD superfamily